MKKICLFHSMLVAVLLAGGFTACSDDDEEKKEPVVETITPYHFDITVTVG